jgi:hypothetical protein
VDDLRGDYGVSAAVFDLHGQDTADEGAEYGWLFTGYGFEVFSPADIRESLKDRVLERCGQLVSAALPATAAWSSRHLPYLSLF